MKKVFLLILAVSFLFSSCTFSFDLKEDKTKDNQKFIGVWFTYKEIEELCNNSNSVEELQNNINEILIKLKDFKVNNIFLHARAFDDCFYNFSIFNVSDYCKDNNGNLKFDILYYFIEIAKEYNILVHAWLNPYRIRNDNRVDKIPSNSYAGKLLIENSNDERIIITDNSIYYNPAYTEVQNYVLNGIREILENYKVSGIHIDDYFYPATNVKIDEIIYNDYLQYGGSLNLADFRRNAVNTLISSIYSLVKSYNNDILVSISPAANIEKNYNNSYADVKFWAQNQGYADIIVPQLYYGFQHSTMPFNKLLDEWMALSNSNTKIVIGLAIYKSGNVDVNTQEGRNEWIENNNIIAEQINHLNNANAHGWSYFSASYLYENINNDTEIEKYNIIQTLNSIWKDYVT